MISLFFTIKGFFNDLMSIGLWLALGAGIGALATVLRPLWGLLGNAAMGAALMAVVILGDWLGDDSERIKKLEAEKYALELKQEELRRTSEALRNTLAKLSDAALHNEKAMERLKSKLESVPECTIPEDVINEILDIR